MATGKLEKMRASPPTSPIFPDSVNRKERVSILVGLYVQNSLLLIVLTAFAFFSVSSQAQTNVSAKRAGVTIHVSKVGDNTDGLSWKTAFHTLQQGLDAVPDALGGHKVYVRPDRYVEANLAPSHKGAEGAYNSLVGDYDGSLGSGATGWVLIDSGDPNKGFKSWDWWGTIRASTTNWASGNNTQTFSCAVWDRWVLRRLYASGGDAGFFFDQTDRSGDPFTVIVEDSVGIGRAFGGGVVYPTVRPTEPSVFRRCHLMALDWMGDTAAVLLGGWELSMPSYPHVVFEDCTMVHPDNAVAISYSSRCARAKFVRCRLLTLNFAQPEMGAKTTGIISTEGHAPKGRLHVDLEDCSLAGYSVFTPGAESKAASWSTRGQVQAYVQFKQEVPSGFKRLGLWPAEWFSHIAPPPFQESPSPANATVTQARP